MLTSIADFFSRPQSSIFCSGVIQVNEQESSSVHGMVHWSQPCRTSDPWGTRTLPMRAKLRKSNTPMKAIRSWQCPHRGQSTHFKKGNGPDLVDRNDAINYTGSR